MRMQLSKKQNEYIVNATHRWNFKSGAVRSGKSYVDTAFVIPFRIRERAGKPGLNVILGVSKESIERNVLQPMREIYTDKLTGTINNRNVARICGEDVYCLGAEKVSQVAKIQGSSIKYCYGDEVAKWNKEVFQMLKSRLDGEDVYCLGAEKVSQVAKIQGSSIKYCYGDEVAKWNKEVFQMLKSRLDKPYSCFDGSCNPEHPTHWLNEFLNNEELDIYLQRYTIFDNPFLPEEFVEQLCKEYEGTIYYDRLILGLWKRVAGAIYKRFADNPAAFRCEVVDELSPDPERKQFKKEDITSIEIGLDFGGNQSGHSFVARGYTDEYRDVIALKSKRIKAKDENDDIDSNKLDELFCEFVRGQQ